MATTITSLLNSLQSHLQSQTQLLPTLHNQLGLPPTALTDELSTLQKQLTECVEAQIDVRRKQVDEWMSRCDEVESRCINYGKALGGHAKATGSSVGEIRKEQVLPRRFEMINEYQEKLRQMYHTKLEQLLTLTNRIASLSRTLGSDYFQSDLLESMSVVEECEDPTEPFRDVTPERFTRIEKELVRGKGEVGKRLHQLSGTFVQIDYLYTELGVPPPSPYDMPSTSTSSRSSITRSTSLTSMLTDPNADPFLSSSTNINTPTPMTRSKATKTPFLLLPPEGVKSGPSENDYQLIFLRFAARLEELSDEELQDPTKPSLGLEGVDPTPGLLSWAETTHAQLEDIKRRRESHIQAMYDQLESLWRRLGVPDAEMDAFVEANRGSTEVTIQAYEEELDRMLELKRERMSTFVENARAEITKLWDDLMVGEEERSDFAPFADDEHSEELLSIHEEEVRRLKEERKLKGSLLTSIRKYFDICQEQKELAAAAADQTRLLGRGPRDPGRLLREEKMRKRVTKEKPRLEQDLLAAIPTWEVETGRTFLVNGESILAILTEASSAQGKENGKRKSRAGSVPARSQTPSMNPPANLGASQAGSSRASSVTPAVRPASSMSITRTAPFKRPKLGETTCAYNNNNAPPSTAARTRHTRSMSKEHAANGPSPPVPMARTNSKASSSRATSSVQRPTPRGAAASTRGGTAGGGRVASAQHHRPRGYHPYQRSTSAAATGYAVMGGAALSSAVAAVTARKATRARRESFKPRPSMDDTWGAPQTDGPRRWAGFAGGTVCEEDEGF